MEAAMFAAQHKLDNLHVIVDANGQQAFGLTRDVLDASNLGNAGPVLDGGFRWQTDTPFQHSPVRLPSVRRRRRPTW